MGSEQNIWNGYFQTLNNRQEDCGFLRGEVYSLFSFLPKGTFCPQLMKRIQAEVRSEEMGIGGVGPVVSCMRPGKRTGRDNEEQESTSLHRGLLEFVTEY